MCTKCILNATKLNGRRIDLFLFSIEIDSRWLGYIAGRPLCHSICCEMCNSYVRRACKYIYHVSVYRFLYARWTNQIFAIQISEFGAPIPMCEWERLYAKCESYGRWHTNEIVIIKCEYRKKNHENLFAINIQHHHKINEIIFTCGISKWFNDINANHKSKTNVFSFQCKQIIAEGGL